MLFAHDVEEALVAAVILVNSAEDPDTMTRVGQLAEFVATQGYAGRIDGDETELAAVRELRPELRTLLLSSRDDAVEIVNAMLRDAQALPQLVRHDRLDWHIHAIDGNRPLAARIRVETAMAMVDVIRSDEMSRLGVCADPDCNGVVLDLSRNRSRIFCSAACGNRAAVAAYRARKAE